MGDESRIKREERKEKGRRQERVDSSMVRMAISKVADEGSSPYSPDGKS